MKGRWSRIRGASLLDGELFPGGRPDGTIQAITAASLEVTQQKKIEKALVQSEKLAVAGRMAASIAHEINNPLEWVTNLVYLAQNSGDLADAKRFMEMAGRELRRVAAITSQTLRFHKQLTSPQEVTAQNLMDNVLSLYEGRIANSAVEVEERRRAETRVRCFEGEIRQVLSNLLSNALDAMHGSGGRLLLRSRDATNWKTGEKGVVVTVADTGVGIPRSAIARIFDAFYTTKDLGGTGLGLWVSREIVARHGGSLRVRSAQGERHHGTVFALICLSMRSAAERAF